MTARDGGSGHPPNSASLEEVFAAIEGLDPQEIVRLKLAAKRLIQKLPHSARTEDDLYQEAMIRLCDGRRQWKKHVPFRKLFEGAMLSIVDDWGKKSRRGFALLSDRDLVARILGLRRGPGYGPGQGAPAAGRAALVFAQVDGREPHTTLLQGWAARMKGPAIREEYGISANGYEAARKWIARNVKTPEELLQVFAHDPTVIAVVQGMKLGLAPETICRRYEISEEQYEAATRELARRPNPATPRGD